MGKGKLILVLGGARSGKSNFAAKLASGISEDVTYVATAAFLDDEMFRRVALQRFVCPSHWNTVEETTHLVSTIKEWGMKSDVVLIDCLSLWLSNLLLDSKRTAPGIPWAEKESYIVNEVEKLAETAVATKAAVIVVSNEVSLGVIPDNRLGQAYRDVTGIANQITAKYADEVYLTLAGIPIEIKSLASKILNLY